VQTNYMTISGRPARRSLDGWSLFSTGAGQFVTVQPNVSRTSVARITNARSVAIAVFTVLCTPHTSITY